MYKIILSNTKDIIPLKGIEEVKKVLANIDAGNNIIICANGVFNPSYLVAILHDGKKASEKAYLQNVGYKDEENSPFAKLFSDQMKMLPEND